MSSESFPSRNDRQSEFESSKNGSREVSPKEGGADEQSIKKSSSAEPVADIEPFPEFASYWHKEPFQPFDQSVSKSTENPGQQPGSLNRLRDSDTHGTESGSLLSPEFASKAYESDPEQTPRYEAWWHTPPKQASQSSDQLLQEQVTPTKSGGLRRSNARRESRDAAARRRSTLRASGDWGSPRRDTRRSQTFPQETIPQEGVSQEAATQAGSPQAPEYPTGLDGAKDYFCVPREKRLSLSAIEELRDAAAAGPDGPTERDGPLRTAVVVPHQPSVESMKLEMERASNDGSEGA